MIDSRITSIDMSNAPMFTLSNNTSEKRWSCRTMNSEHRISECVGFTRERSWNMTRVRGARKLAMTSVRNDAAMPRVSAG